MKIKKATLLIFALAITLCLLAACGNGGAAPSTPPAAVSPSPVDFSGHWEDPASTFSLDLSQNLDQLHGSHVSVALQGAKIDSLENSIQGSVQGNVATVKFQSSFAADLGTARITFIDQDTIFWEVAVPPGGEYYLPKEATLVKKSPAPTMTPAAAAPVQWMPPASSSSQMPPLGPLPATWRPILQLVSFFPP